MHKLEAWVPTAIDALMGTVDFISEARSDVGADAADWDAP
jgi:hypothetical protein